MYSTRVQRFHIQFYNVFTQSSEVHQLPIRPHHIISSAQCQLFIIQQENNNRTFLYTHTKSVVIIRIVTTFIGPLTSGTLPLSGSMLKKATGKSSSSKTALINTIYEYFIVNSPQFQLISSRIGSKNVIRSFVYLCKLFICCIYCAHPTL